MQAFHIPARLSRIIQLLAIDDDVRKDHVYRGSRNCTLSITECK